MLQPDPHRVTPASPSQLELLRAVGSGESISSQPVPPESKPPAIALPGSVHTTTVPARAEFEIRTTDLSNATFPHDPAIARAAGEPRAQIVSAAQIGQTMQHRGFPELEKLWRGFQRAGVPIENLTDTQISVERNRHMAPLFGRPLVVGAGLALVGVAGGLQFLRGIPEVTAALFPAGKIALGGIAACNYSFLAGYGATIVQRYFTAPLGRTMERDTGYMLSRVSFRESQHGTPRKLRCEETLRTLGVNERWDDPQYQAFYRSAQGSWEEVRPMLPSERILEALRELLGQKDDETRRFVPGRHMASLLHGKKSVTQFVQRFGSELAKARQGEIDRKAGAALLTTLRDEFVTAESPGAKRLSEAIDALQDESKVPDGCVQARIWERDPWVDLTHQEEFYSSASLRGVKLMGRGPKGRLGTFGYLRNPSISALDFSTKKGRVVRARLGASAMLGEDGTTRPFLFVDGVEGSNALPPGIIRTAIERYAREAGFKGVAYNEFVHNQVPKRFVRFLAEQGIPAKTVTLAYLDASTREYLDAFGWPLEPFEYQHPRGAVVARVVSFDSAVEKLGHPPTVFERAVRALKRSALWILVGEATAFAGFVVAETQPTMLLPLGAILGAGVGTHVWYQRRSLRK